MHVPVLGPDQKIVAGEGKKARNFGSHHLRSPTTFGAPPFKAPPFKAPPFKAPPFKAPPFKAPPFGAPPHHPSEHRPSEHHPSKHHPSKHHPSWFHPLGPHPFVFVVDFFSNLAQSADAVVAAIARKDPFEFFDPRRNLPW